MFLQCKECLERTKNPATYRAELGYLIKLEVENHVTFKKHLEVIYLNDFCVYDQMAISKIYQEEWPTSNIYYGWFNVSYNSP